MKYCNAKILSKIDGYISENKDKIVSDLMDAVRIPSVTGEAEEGAPYGKNCARMLKYTADLFEKNGFKTEINEKYGYALSYAGTGDKSIGLFAHVDVVPVDDKWQICPPFEPVVRDGYMFGRGCYDDKSGVISMLYAAKIIKECGFDFKSRLVMFSGSNEESGMNDITAFAKCESMPDVSLVPDAMYPCIFGERSIMDFDIVSRRVFSKIKKFHGGEAANIVLGFVAVEIDYSEELWIQICDAVNGNDDFSVNKDGSRIYVTAKGISNHVMDAETSVNAGKVMCDMLLGCSALEEDLEILKDLAKYLDGCNGKGFEIEHSDEFGKLICANGIIRLTDDFRLKVTFDCRCGLSCNIEDAQKRIIKICGDSWEFDLKNLNVGYSLPEDMPAKLIMEEVYECVSGIKGKKGIRIAGGSYARKLKNALPIGVTVEGENNDIQLPEGHGGVHQPDEKISIDGLLKSIKIITCALLEIDKTDLQ